MEKTAIALSESLGTRTFKTKIRVSDACEAALTVFYKPLHLFKPHATTTRDYDELVDEILEVI